MGHISLSKVEGQDMVSMRLPIYLFKMLKLFFKKCRALFRQYILTSSGEPLAEVRFSVRFCESQELSALAAQMSRSHLNPNPTMTIA